MQKRFNYRKPQHFGEFNISSRQNKKNIRQMLAIIKKTITDMRAEANTFVAALNAFEVTHGKYPLVAEIATIFPYIELSIIDILILHRLYLINEDPMVRNFICRTAAQHMYEFLEDFGGVLGKQMNLLLNNHKTDQVVKKQIELRESFNKLKKELHKPLKEIRNNISAHKDRDIRKQIAQSDQIELVDFHLKFIKFMLFFIVYRQFKNLVFAELKKKKEQN